MATTAAANVNEMSTSEFCSVRVLQRDAIELISLVISVIPCVLRCIY